MDIRTNVKAEIEDLQQRISSLKKKGPFLQGIRVERVPAGGTASKKAQNDCKYARLRAGRGNLLDNSKKSGVVHREVTLPSECLNERLRDRLQRA